ncbi:MAG: 2-hydroxyacyl-CoA dehydratase [Bacteroidales bacterium]|nr:2-hydroxyacyl-CoA dehydratase [Bacteroidales bacterium]
MYRIGVDIGSTTIKCVALDKNGNQEVRVYRRHNAKIREALLDVLDEVYDELGNVEVSIGVTGSIGMGVAEKCGFPFVQEVLAATKAIRHKGLAVSTMIDIGGEDAKVVFFNAEGEAEDHRMNGNCAGGTGAFIDQMAVILNEDVDELSHLAEKSTRTYPIASRCGVFSKTDVQNLVAKRIPKEDVAASIFRAVVVQTVITLAHGARIKPPVLFCGGPLTFIPALRNAYKSYLHLDEEDIVRPDDSELMPALGTAVGHQESSVCSLSEIIQIVKESLSASRVESNLPPLFRDEDEHKDWSRRLCSGSTVIAHLEEGYVEGWLGIDSGSTTTKVVLIDKDRNVLFRSYAPNGGDPVTAVRTALESLDAECIRNGTILNIVSACSTGYGEDLIKAAFSLDYGIIETIAHFIAAKTLDPEVSFILDIGGQDMKAIYVHEGVIDRIEINEACSSGCGSFLETFAKSTGYDVASFAYKGCLSKTPCDLGTRCTVFMNSKVKQVLREGYSVEDISAGLAYSVIRNCLYKVLKITDISTLGKNIVVQGGTMKNDAVVKALENLTGAQVRRSAFPELMGAYGCAVYAMEHKTSNDEARLPSMLVDAAEFTPKTLRCHGCENGCAILAYKFKGNRTYYSGNRCEKIFNNSGEKVTPGDSVYKFKQERIFRQEKPSNGSSLKIGIPRCLNVWEDFPFWNALFGHCGFIVLLSSPSEFSKYEDNAGMVMSDNICFPAKLVHSHISDLGTKGVDRIFMPFVVHSRMNRGDNSYNCPIVTGYSEVVKNVQPVAVPFDSPVFSMKDLTLFRKQCIAYLCTLGVSREKASEAFDVANNAYLAYGQEIAEQCGKVLDESRKDGKVTILLAGRPYHSDPLIQHDVAGMIASMGVDVISEDIVRGGADENMNGVNFVSQWTYTNRIMQAARWCAAQGPDVQFVQMTSFGCGPDAFLIDIVRDILKEGGKALTLVKLDDINNVGSMKLRVRSLVESIRLSVGKPARTWWHPVMPPRYEDKDRNRKILIPFFTPFISPLIPPLMANFGYDVECLPISDEKSVEYGLKYANNEVCYPATLVVGDLIKALEEGGYDPDRTALAMTQTGGQCRASNYLPLIKKALTDAGYTDTPVISVAFGSGLNNDQPGFKVNWLKAIPAIVYTLLFSDSVAKMYYAAAAREKVQGEAATLKDKYLYEGGEVLRTGKWNGLLNLISKAAGEFDAICSDKECPKAGVVGEIYLKFNPFAHKNVVDWLMEQGVEIAPPILTDFFTQFFVNSRTRKYSLTEKNNIPDFVYDAVYGLLKRQVRKFEQAASGFRFFTPFNDIFDEASEASGIINLNTQFGEGWLLPGEIATYYRNGIKNVISLQPFGCIANHIIERGVEKRLKKLFPQLNLLSLDFDSGVSDVNVINRMLLFVDNLK